MITSLSPGIWMPSSWNCQTGNSRTLSEVLQLRRLRTQPSSEGRPRKMPSQLCKVALSWKGSTLSIWWGIARLMLQRSDESQKATGARRKSGKTPVDLTSARVIALLQEEAAKRRQTTRIYTEGDEHSARELLAQLKRAGFSPALFHIESAVSRCGSRCRTGGRGSPSFRQGSRRVSVRSRSSYRSARQSLR